MYTTRMTNLQRVQQNDENSWHDFYVNYSPLIHWLCRRRGLDCLDARQTVVQQVMRHFHEKDWEYDPERGKFRNLVLKVSEYKILEVRRQTNPGKIDFLPPEEMSRLQHNSVSVPQESGPILEKLEQLMVDENLPKSHRRAFILLLEGHSVKETALSCELSESNVKVIKHRLLKRLRQQLEQPE